MIRTNAALVAAVVLLLSVVYSPAEATGRQDQYYVWTARFAGQNPHVRGGLPTRATAINYANDRGEQDILALGNALGRPVTSEVAQTLVWALSHCPLISAPPIEANRLSLDEPSKWVSYPSDDRVKLRTVLCDHEPGFVLDCAFTGGDRILRNVMCSYWSMRSVDVLCAVKIGGVWSIIDWILPVGCGNAGIKRLQWQSRVVLPPPCPPKPTYRPVYEERCESWKLALSPVGLVAGMPTATRYEAVKYSGLAGAILDFVGRATAALLTQPGRVENGSASSSTAFSNQTLNSQNVNSNANANKAVVAP